MKTPKRFNWRLEYLNTMTELPINQIICGDCLEVMKDWPQGIIDLCVADPPYGQTSLRWDRTVSGWPKVVPCRSVWIFGTLRSFMALCDELKDWNLSQDVIWEKHNGSNFHADRFRRVHEQVAHFYKGTWNSIYHHPVFTMDATKRTVRRKSRPPHTGLIGNGHYESRDGGPRLMRSVLHVRSCHGTAVHPTQKPFDLIVPLIEYACPKDGIVLDLFCGSGTTCAAAKTLGRRYIGIDISEEYCQIARDRLTAVDTGVPVKEARNGQKALW